MNKFTFVSYDGKVTFKGNVFNGADKLAREYGKASFSLAKIAEYCAINGIDIGLCFDVNEIRYFPYSAKSMEVAFADIVNAQTEVYGYNKNGTNDIIIISAFGEIFDGFDKSGFRVYNIPNGLHMYVHMNEFTENLLNKHFNEIFYNIN